MKRLCLAVSSILFLVASGALSQVEITDVSERFFREFERRQVTIGVGGTEQIGVSCNGGHILSAGGFSLQGGPESSFRYERLDLSNVHITTVSSAYIYAVNRGDREFRGTVLAYALCWKL